MKAFLFLLVFIFFLTVEAKYSHGKFSTTDNFHYVEKFCFATDKTDPGTMVFSATTKQASQLLLVTYQDFGDHDWNEVYKKGLDCKTALLKSASNTSFSSDVPQPFEFFETQRPHYWYIALLNCGGQQYDIEYHIEFKQAKADWNQQFSFDEQYLELTYILFSVVYFLGFLIHLFGDFQFYRTKSFHPVIRLLTISITFELLSVWSYLIHYVIYSRDGVGSYFLYIMGNIFDYLAALVFMLLLILIAKGWGITYPSISHIQDQRLVLFGILVIFFIFYVVLFFWSLFGLDPASTVYVYQSIPGIIFLVVRFVTLLYFLFCIFRTLREENDESKRKFYVIFGAGYTFWFLSLPLLVLLALRLDIWVRMKVVTGIYLTVTTLGYFVIATLLWPRWAGKYFQVAVPDLLSTQYERL
jgi:hypothetical protein